MEQTTGNWQWAVLAMDQGKKVTRDSWGEPQSYIRRVDPTDSSDPFAFADKNLSKEVFPPFLALRLSGKTEKWYPYQPTQVDMLATDWKVIT